MIRRLFNSLRFRASAARFGIFYLRSPSFKLDRIRVSGRRIRLAFPPTEKPILEHELNVILFQDCYGLSQFRGRIRTVLDIGANVGLFDLAARHHFPKASIHCYEPNSDLEGPLRQHCDPISVKVHMAAVAAQGGRVTLQRQANSLHTTAAKTTGDGIPCVAFGDAIERMGGQVDLLKLDCEGGEWSLFEDVESWKRIGALTMEYHLWAKPGSTLEDLRQKLTELGFETLAVKEGEDGTFGMLRARNRFRKQAAGGDL